MTVGIVMLVHTAFHRAAQVARYWSKSGCPVVIHVDSAVPDPAYQRFAQSLGDLPDLLFSTRHRCEWGSWGLVAASQGACEQLLRRFPNVRHVYLTSGSCLPLRPVEELNDYLAERSDTDFIESANTRDVPWTVGGLDHERFTLHFPFSWRRQRWLFDRFVNVQRRLGVRRGIPAGLHPHMGSQWWCLTRETLGRILNHPDRKRYDAYFRGVWIPDEAYFQTLARQCSDRIESRSLTLSKFDFQGKPHVFYDDHLQLLRRSDCFIARKIWPRADGLYNAFLDNPKAQLGRMEPNPGKIDRIFVKAVERRTRGRAGLYMQSRFPVLGRENGVTAGTYSVFQGFAELYDDFEGWLAKATGARVHGHLFAKEKACFAEGAQVVQGGLSNSAALRDYNPKSFLTNLIWNTRGERQCFQFGPADNVKVLWDMAHDPNAQISVIAGAWAVPLFRSDGAFADLRKEAARLQKIEAGMLRIMRAPDITARIRVWSMAEFIETPMEALQLVIEESGLMSGHRLTEAPRMRDLSGFGTFLQKLKNEGMHPYLMGDFPIDPSPKAAQHPGRRPYVATR